MSASDPTAPLVLAVPLGCCPGPERCVLCPPPPQVSPELVEALVDSALRDAREAGDTRAPRVRFFGGAPPSPAQIEAIRGLPFEVRVRPDLLSRSGAIALAAAGCEHVELDALTFVDAALQAAGRPYRAARVEEMSRALPELGVQVGGVLAPGLSRTTAQTAVQDVRTAIPLWSTLRLHPVLVLDRSRLRRLHEAQIYAPLSLDDAVATCVELVDLAEAAGLRVLRVGLQPGPDGLGRAVAGPHEPGFRELVEERRTLARMRPLFEGVPRGASVTVRCAPADHARTRGRLGGHVRLLRAAHGLTDLRVEVDPTLARGALRVQVEPLATSPEERTP
jgi:hypothetical protein